MLEQFKLNGIGPLGQKTALDSKKRQFLELLVSTGLPSEAAEALGESKTEVYKWRAQDPFFAKKWDQIIQGVIVPILEAEAARRAISGSDALLMFLLKAYDRKRFDDKVAMLNQTGTSLNITIRDAEGKVVASTETIDKVETDF